MLAGPGEQYFAVVVEDVDHSTAWNQTVFGLKALGGSAAEDGSWRIENLGNAQLMIEIVGQVQTPAVERTRGFWKVGFQVPDVERVADRGARGERTRVVDDTRLGLRIIQLRDPDGNVVQLASPLAP